MRGRLRLPGPSYFRGGGLSGVSGLPSVPDFMTWAAARVLMIFSNPFPSLDGVLLELGVDLSPVLPVEFCRSDLLAGELAGVLLRSGSFPVGVLEDLVSGVDLPGVDSLSLLLFTGVEELLLLLNSIAPSDSAKGVLAILADLLLPAGSVSP